MPPGGTGVGTNGARRRHILLSWDFADTTWVEGTTFAVAKKPTVGHPRDSDVVRGSVTRSVRTTSSHADSTMSLPSGVHRQPMLT